MLADIRGRRYGRLVVLERAANDKHQKAMWLCQCDCGNQIIVRGGTLRSGQQKSCGCYNKELQANFKGRYKHGGKDTRLYTIWKVMRQRCFNPHTTNYKNYGGRGITICEEWNDFSRFREWALNNGYADNLSIDRINVDGNYEPQNCRWSTVVEQARNKRNTMMIYYKGKPTSVRQVAEEVGIEYGTLRGRIIRGWSVDRAINTPTGG